MDATPQEDTTPTDADNIPQSSEPMNAEPSEQTITIELTDVITPTETEKQPAPTETTNNASPDTNAASPENTPEKPTIPKRIGNAIKTYFFKVKGVKGTKNPYKRPTILNMFVAYIASFVGMMSVGLLHYYAIVNQKLDPTSQASVVSMLIGSFGASAVLIYGEIKSPLAQPRNFVGGHFFSALVGIICRIIVDATTVSAWVLPYFGALAVATSIFVMHITRTTHPPGGASALIAVMSPLYPWYGFQYLFIPILSGCLVMLVIAIVINNLSPENNYPLYWW
jgi:hypothetical protein